MRTWFSTKLSAGRSIFWHFSISWILYAHSECHTLQFCWLTSAHVLVLVFRGIVLGLSGFDWSKKKSPISCWSQWTYFLLFPFLESCQFLLFKKKKSWTVNPISEAGDCSFFEEFKIKSKLPQSYYLKGSISFLGAGNAYCQP